MPVVTLYGATYSVYVRAVRMALAEKGVSHDLVEVDVFAAGGPPDDHLVRHPFGKIPVLEHDGFQIYETAAITRYVDEAFPGPSLQPADVRDRARMTQIIGVMDSHFYSEIVWGLYVARSDARRAHRPFKEAEIRRQGGRAETCLRALDALAGRDVWLAGEALSLADIHAAPMFALFLQTPEGEELLPGHSRLRSWWAAISARASFAATA